MKAFVITLVLIAGLIYSVKFWPESWLTWVSRKLKNIEVYLDRKQSDRKQINEHLIRKIVNEELDKRKK